MKKIVSVVFALLCAVSLSACMTPSKHNSEAVEQADPVQLFLTGTIEYKDLEGGFYAIKGDDGKNYVPVNLSKDYQKDGLTVRVKAVYEKEMMGIQMYGQMITIESITAI